MNATRAIAPVRTCPIREVFEAAAALYGLTWEQFAGPGRGIVAVAECRMVAWVVARNLTGAKWVVIAMVSRCPCHSTPAMAEWRYRFGGRDVPSVLHEGKTRGEVAAMLEAEVERARSRTPAAAAGRVG